MNRKRIRKGTALLLVPCFCLIPFHALAGSPEFAYSAEKWASLRDNELDFEEIGDLIHEYNNTVIQNQIAYKEYKEESRDEIAQDYYDAASDVESSLNYPDSDDANYAGSLSSYLNGQIQADELRKKGDDNVEDGEIKKLEYEKEEAELTKEAQELMIDYWSQVWSLSNLEKTKEQQEASYESAVTSKNAGTGTEADILSAREAVLSAEASILSAQSGLDKTKESLCLMLGWSYGAEVSMKEVPEPDLESISSIDMDGDVEKGLEANYALQILKKKIDNAQSANNKASLEEQYKSQKEKGASNIKAAYRSLLLSKSEYDQALQSCQVEKENMDTAQRKLAAGTITRNAYTRQQDALQTAEISIQAKKLELLKARLEYDWAVKGLASVT